MNILLRCTCGAVELRVDPVDPSTSNRVVCHCSGCRAWARRMEPSMLDAMGGTERFQVSPDTIEVTRGSEQIACIQQTPKGALRWYASCCGAPLGLTLETPRVPFVGLASARIDEASLQADIEELLGPVRARVNVEGARRIPREARATLGALAGMLGHLGPLVARWWWRGAHRRTPFFSPETGEPVARVRRLHEE